MNKQRNFLFMSLINRLFGRLMMIYDNENQPVDGEIKCSDGEFISVNPSLVGIFRSFRHK